MLGFFKMKFFEEPELEVVKNIDLAANVKREHNVEL